MSQALSGVSVLDLTETVSGAYCTMLMADLGADVVKVEPPEGDPMRGAEPVFKGISPKFTAYNRGKKSITLDLQSGADVERLKGILPRFDIIIEDRPHGSLDHIGLAYDTVKVIHPSLIYAEITGFGTGNRYQNRPVYESTLQAESGMSFSVLDDSKGTPYLIGGELAGAAGAYFTLIPVLAALHERLAHGAGQKIEVNIYYILLSMMHFNILDYQYNHILYPGHGGGSPCGFVHTKDGVVRITCSVKAMWDRTKELLNDPALNDPRFDDPVQREKEEPLLLKQIEAHLCSMTSREVEEMFTKAGITVGVVRTIDDIRSDPHLEARGQIVPIEVPDLGALPYFASPFRLSKSTPEYRRAPLPGEHNSEYLSDFQNEGGASL